MLKSYILNYQTSIKNSIKSSWFTWWVLSLILFPLGLFSLLIIFENEIAGLIMTLYPPGEDQGISFYQDYVHIARMEVLWTGLFFLLCLVLFAYPSKVTLNNLLNDISQ